MIEHKSLHLCSSLPECLQHPYALQNMRTSQGSCYLLLWAEHVTTYLGNNLRA